MVFDLVGLGIYWQLGAFIVSSILLIIFTRPLITKYFKSVLSDEKITQRPAFKGNIKKEEQKEKNDIKSIVAIGFGVLGFVGLSFALFKNYQKTLKNLDTFVQKFEHNEIVSKILLFIFVKSKKLSICLSS